MLISRPALVAGLVAVVVAACSSGATPSPSPSEVPSAAPTEASAAPSETSASTGEASVTGPASVEAGAEFEAAWTGPNAAGDYVTIVAAGTTAWTDESWFYTNAGPTGKLTAPLVAGEYELWYVNGADDTVAARSPIAVTGFAATLDAAAAVQAGSEFEVAWTGPNGPGDYVTIVATGATAWTDESYFYTSYGSPGKLVALLEPGPGELWYVTGQSPDPLFRRPITISPLQITLDAPAKVKAGAEFQVTWTGPNGPKDYITIVPAGSPEGTYNDYAYTSEGPTVTITAPSERGAYEIWYASDRVAGTFAMRPITVE